MKSYDLVDWDPRLDALGLTVERAEDTQPYYRLIAAWLTVAGNWDDVPQFARQYQQDVLGGDHHVFGMALDAQGKPLPEAGFVMVWPDGGAQRTPADCNRPDWADLPIYAGYDWAQVSGPYTWAKYGNADRLCGAGLPFPPLPWQPQGDAYAEGGVHVSYFCVWQAADAEVEPPPPPSLSWRCRLAERVCRLASWLCPDVCYPRDCDGCAADGDALDWDDDDEWDDWPTADDYLRAFKEMAGADTLVEMGWHDATGLKVETLDMR